MGINPAGARRYYTNSGAPSELIKHPQTFDPRCQSPFLHGSKCHKFWPKFRPQSSSDRVFLNCGALSEIKNKLVKDDDMSITIPNLD